MDSTPLCLEKGDLKAGFDESDHLLEGEMRVGGQVGQALHSKSMSLGTSVKDRWGGRGAKIRGTSGRFHDKPVSGNKPCNGHPVAGRIDSRLT